MKVVITGGLGFLGLRLARRLLELDRMVQEAAETLSTDAA